MRRDERGFALIVVLLVLALVTLVAAEFAFSMRLEAAAVRAYRDGVIGAHLAETAVAQALREIVADAPLAAEGPDGRLSFYTAEGEALPRLAREGVEFAGGRYTYRLTDEEARLNVNTAAPDRLERLLGALGVTKQDRDTVIASLLDWRDPNEAHRLNGAESEDTYLKLDVPYRARNADLESVTELLQIKGVSRALYHGRDGDPGLADLVTVKTPGEVNINTAPPAVLEALGLSAAEIAQIVQARRLAPYPSVPGQFGGRGLTATTQTFRIEAEGLVGGQVAAEIRAIVQRRAEGGEPGVVVLEWLVLR